MYKSSSVCSHLHTIINNFLLFFNSHKTIITHSLGFRISLFQLNLLIGTIFTHQSSTVSAVMTSPLQVPVVLTNQTTWTVCIVHPLDLIVRVISTSASA
jgi:hypothetical protein